MLDYSITAVGAPKQSVLEISEILPRRFRRWAHLDNGRDWY